MLLWIKKDPSWKDMEGSPMSNISFPCHRSDQNFRMPFWVVFFLRLQNFQGIWECSYLATLQFLYALSHSLLFLIQKGKPTKKHQAIKLAEFSGIYWNTKEFESAIHRLKLGFGVFFAPNLPMKFLKQSKLTCNLLSLSCSWKLRLDLLDLPLWETFGPNRMPSLPVHLSTWLSATLASKSHLKGAAVYKNTPENENDNGKPTTWRWISY